jgi:hypothetical protein
MFIITYQMHIDEIFKIDEICESWRESNDTDFGVHSVASENVKSENGTY